MSTKPKAARKIPAPKKNGRPTKYDPKFIALASSYLAECKDTESEFWKTRGEKSDSYDRIITVKLPTIEGFAAYLNVAVSSLYLWEEDNPKFSEALEEIKSAQKERLIAKGLSGEYNPTIAKLILSSNHGMRERSDVTSDDKALPVPIIPYVHRDNSDEENQATKKTD